jgi:hypothetical protein
MRAHQAGSVTSRSVPLGRISNSGDASKPGPRHPTRSQATPVSGSETGGGSRLRAQTVADVRAASRSLPWRSWASPGLDAARVSLRLPSPATSLCYNHARILAPNVVSLKGQATRDTNNGCGKAIIPWHVVIRVGAQACGGAGRPL